jgi:hypothetical protein
MHGASLTRRITMKSIAQSITAIVHAEAASFGL